MDNGRFVVQLNYSKELVIISDYSLSKIYKHNNKMRFPTSSDSETEYYLGNMMDTLTSVMHADVQGLFH